MTQMDAVEQKLRRMILDMEIGPGERLSERGIEALLGASRTPVRSALQRLEVEGLVRREGRGWLAAPIDLKEIEQLFVYREILEVAALRQAASMIDAASLADIETLLNSCGADATLEQRHLIGLEFHVRLARISGNQFLERGVADAVNRLSRVRWLETNPSHPGWKEHRAILSALRKGSVEQAVHMLEAHIRQSRDQILALLQESRRSLRSRGVVVV